MSDWAQNEYADSLLHILPLSLTFFDFVAVPLPLRRRCKKREKTDRLGAIAPNLSEVDIVNDMLPAN